MSQKIVVIGGGPAGIEAARAAALTGGQVTLVSEEQVGGRATWHSLLPSKVWLTAADTAGLLAESPTLAGGAAAPPDSAAVLARIQAVKQSWHQYQADQLRALGVELVSGTASFAAANEVIVKDSDGQETARLEADRVIIASGSVPVFPPKLKPNGKNVLAPRFAASKLHPLPKSVAVIGAGATGTEFVYLFNRLGVAVTWIVDPYGVLPVFAPQAGELLTEILTRRGVRLVSGQFADRIEADDDGVTVLLANGEPVTAEMAFVAIGRRPDVDRLNLEAAGLSLGEASFPVVDEFCQTAVPGVYAVGDAAGPPMVANRAMAQAWIAGQHAAGANPPAYRPDTVIAAIYTEPQAAQIGIVQGDGLHTVRAPFAATLKTHLLPEQDGFVELTCDAEGRLVGGLAVGPHAADALAPVAVAIQLHAKLSDLAPVYGAHPSISELPFMAMRG